ncbi:MAG: tRNA (adenosine(37)-N6)-threonylcarbamoyltransferase complex dimerization subunit type 1 TsaB [Clostridia bacterium]|nr:tRNA (adenosine(37)-N6)-threonylcarbamoyltransferase complex dimerization subunit type 1 TsaB [Clostridia bacterium]
MKFLAIDTSGKSLAVVSYCDGKTQYSYLPESQSKHSVVLMDRIENSLKRAKMKAGDCDFFGVVVGPGSFTGIRIGIATVKGLCFACDKKAVAVTSLDCIAYAETGAKRLALVDALHGNYYASAYSEENGVDAQPAFLSGNEVNALIQKGYAPRYPDGLDTAKGLLNAILAHKDKLIDAKELTALYLRKSSAEENR